MYYPTMIPAQQMRAVGDDGPGCASCLSGYVTAFVIGGLVSAVVLLAVAPAARLHKEYRKES